MLPASFSEKPFGDSSHKQRRRGFRGIIDPLHGAEFLLRALTTDRYGSELSKANYMDSKITHAPEQEFDLSREEKGNYRKVTVTLPPNAYELLIRECARRKIAGKSNHLVSAVVREALLTYLNDPLGDGAKITER
jgi:transcriptional regulator of met regulon